MNARGAGDDHAVDRGSSGIQRDTVGAGTGQIARCIDGVQLVSAIHQPRQRQTGVGIGTADGHGVPRSIRSPGDAGLVGHTDIGVDQVSRASLAALHRGIAGVGQCRRGHTGSRCGGVHHVAGVVRYRGVGQGGAVASCIGDGAAVEAQAVSVNADATCIGLA